MKVLSLVFWKNIWNWCKVNWKFLIGFAIPCVVLYFLNQRKAIDILRKGIEFRKKQLSIAETASNVENEMIKENAQNFVEETKDINSQHKKDLENLENVIDLERERIKKLDQENITNELKERFDLD